MSNEYSVRYLPVFYSDLDKVVTYIAFQLHNPKAANDLVDHIETAILKRLPYAESFEPFQSEHKRKHPYYRIYVDNYIIYYVVLVEEGKRIVEVRRLLYCGQDRDKML